MIPRKRFRRFSVAAGLGLFLVAGQGFAQGFAVDRHEPSAPGDAFFIADHPNYARRFQVQAAITGDYAYAPLTLRQGTTATALIEHMLVMHAGIGVSFLDRVGVNVSLPVSLLQSGQGTLLVGAFNAAGAPNAGDLRLGARVRIFGQPDRDPISLHFGAQLFLGGLWNNPSGNSTDGYVRGRLGLTAAGRVGPIRGTVQIGAHIRPKLSLDSSGGTTGTELFATWGVGYVTAQNRFMVGLEGSVSTVVEQAFAYREFNAELSLGAHYRIADVFLIGAGAGPGLTHGAGTPAARVLLQLAYAPVDAPEKATPRAPLDNDHDGIENEPDQCPEIAMGTHPDATRLGCPLVDTDGDGVFDNQDQCVNVSAGDHPDPDKIGCPLIDSDGDGVFDPKDQCVSVPMGEHPDPDKPGCPDGDGDADGVLDHADQCAAEPQGLNPDTTRAGCPLPDRDHDIVPDATDHCPDQAGAPSTEPTKNGCPGDLQVENNTLHIVRPVFFATSRDTILPRSFSVLVSVANTLRAVPAIRKVSIEGHTDDVGDPTANQSLSERRAASVLRFLVEHGVEASRLESHGFGSSRPLQPTETLRGRAVREARSANRRVEFRITDPASQSTASGHSS